MNFREFLQEVMETQLVAVEQVADLEEEYLRHIENQAGEAEWLDMHAK